MSITDVRQWKISDGQVILREEGNVTKISICVIQACWSSLTLNSADMASDATVIFCLFYETTWDRCPLVLFPRTPPRDEVVELRVVKVIRERLNQILMNSFCYKLFPPTHISQTSYGSVCIDSCFLCIRGSDNFLMWCWQNHLGTVMHTVFCRCFLSLYWCLSFLLDIRWRRHFPVLHLKYLGIK